MEKRKEEADRSLRISVVIPHLNQPEMLDRCLASIWSGSRRPDQVFVVDNGSAALPEAVLAAHPGTVLLHEPTPGPGPARNMGAAAADGDILAFTDADCLADRDWLAAMEAAFADPEAQILGGDVRIALIDPARLTMLEAYESIYGYRADRYIPKQGFTVTCNLAMRPAVLADVGAFGGLSIAEDREWGQRATARGYRIRYVAGMRIYHPARTTFRALQAKWDRQLGHDYTEARQSGLASRAKWAAKTLVMGLSPLAEVPRILLTNRIAGPRSRMLAFLCLIRSRFHRMHRMAWLMAGGDPDILSGRWNRPAGG